MEIALIIVLVILLIGAAISCRWRERLTIGTTGASFPPVQDALGYQIALPGDPYKNIMRRSVSYPPHPMPVGGLGDFYYKYDPAYSTEFDRYYCEHDPIACAGTVLEP